MSSDPSAGIDYELVLADLRAKRDKLDAAITGIETMLGVRGLASEPSAKPSATPGNDLGPGAFLGMTIVDATVKLLQAKRANQRTEDILSALKAGGIALASSNPINTVGSVLNRDWAQGGEIVRVDRGVWGLAAWHPRLRKKSAEPKNGNGSTEGQKNQTDEVNSGEADNQSNP